MKRILLTPNTIEKFWARSQKGPNCWEWTGTINREGYGQMFTGSIHASSEFHYGATPAHRISYALAHGEIPADLVIDHLCFNRTCVNPEHLEAVVFGENSRRALVRRWNRSDEDRYGKSDYWLRNRPQDVR